MSGFLLLLLGGQMSVDEWDDNRANLDDINAVPCH